MVKQSPIYMYGCELFKSVMQASALVNCSSPSCHATIYLSSRERMISISCREANTSTQTGTGSHTSSHYKATTVVWTKPFCLPLSVEFIFSSAHFQVQKSEYKYMFKAVTSLTCDCMLSNESKQELWPWKDERTKSIHGDGEKGTKMCVCVRGVVRGKVNPHMCSSTFRE